MSTEQSQALFAPLTKQLHLPLSPSQAFARFAERFGDWWPRQKGHSVFGDASTGCRMEAGVDGRILEFGTNDQCAEWGRVSVWEPPQRLEFLWYPGRDARTAQRVAVSFSADEQGTLIELTHYDWHLLGERAAATRQSYDQGWEQVLGTFGAHAARTAQTTRFAVPPRGWVVAQQLLIAASPERLWTLLATADGMNQWFTDATTLAPEPGGELVFRWRNLASDGGLLEMFGRVRVYEPCQCFAFDWQADSGTYDLHCRIDFESAASRTRISLSETGFQQTPVGLQDLLNRQGGWAQQLTRLQVFAEHQLRL